MRSKYHSRKTFYHGQNFDSKKEAKRYSELKLLEQAGIIASLQRQVKFILIPTQREQPTLGKRGSLKLGKVLEREVAYVADFVYEENGETVVEDTKGFRTKDYIIKRKLMLFVHGIRIREI